MFHTRECCAIVLTHGRLLRDQIRSLITSFAMHAWSKLKTYKDRLEMT